jgi:hypothetical protein
MGGGGITAATSKKARKERKLLNTTMSLAMSHLKPNEEARR